MLGPMKREALELHLARTKRHVIRGERCILRLLVVIEKMRTGGHNAEEAERLLISFREIQASHADSEARLMAELVALGR
jgi:hypothetical protein